MVSDAPWLNQPDASLMGKWGPWIATMRSTYEVNVNMWKTLLEHGEETFFKLFKESPMYSDAMEKQIRDVWQELKKVQNNQSKRRKSFWKEWKSSFSSPGRLSETRGERVFLNE